MRGDSGEFDIGLTAWALIAFAVTWALLGVAAVAAPDLPATAWAWYVAQAFAVQVVVGVLVLPAVVALWAWQADLAIAVRLLVDGFLVAWTLTALRGAVTLRSR